MNGRIKPVDSIQKAPGLEFNANRLTYLDEYAPFRPDLHFPKLTTPGWIGEDGVEAVVILAVDDLRDPAEYERFLRPILNRLKRIDGRAPVSIMTCKVDPLNPQLQTWLREGVSLEVHTLEHPCPLLTNGDFSAASKDVYDCLDLLNRIPGNQPVAFRMPCCDAINSPSPRFYAEIFDGRSPDGNFLQLDSSVMNITSAKDKSLPAAWTMDADGREKFRKYIPSRRFGTTIEDYPYPYIVGRRCWEFPCAVPSDWEAFRLHGAANPQTVSDWKTLLDITVHKQGVFNFVFHPYGWITNAQIVQFIDYANEKYGRRVKFVTFHEALECLSSQLLAGETLRDAAGDDNGVRLVDLNNDGHLDVLIGNGKVKKTRLWNSRSRKWKETAFPAALVTRGAGRRQEDSGVQFGIVQKNGLPSMLVRNGVRATGWDFNGVKWVENKCLLKGLTFDGQTVTTRSNGRDCGVRLRDVDHDGICELILGNRRQSAIFKWTGTRWVRLHYTLPKGTMLVDKDGRDAGMRFVDLNNDGIEDIVFSNEEKFSISLFQKGEKAGLLEAGFRTVKSGLRKGPEAIPMIVRGGKHRNNGVWFGQNHLWAQNEDTFQLPDSIERRSFEELISSAVLPGSKQAGLG